MKMNPVIFREYDIRGVVDVDYDLDFARQLGRAYAVLVAEQNPKVRRQVSIGYDARLSSPAIAEALIKGLNESGFDVVEIGLVTSPILYFSTFTLPDIAGGIMVTGSHNPPEYNGFKIGVGKSTIFGAEIQKLKAIIDSGKFLDGSGKRTRVDIFTSYLKRYSEEFSKVGPLKVVFDCGNGTAGVVVRQLAERVGLNAEIIFEKPDGTFPNHHPDPTVEKNLKDLKAAVAKNKAVVGIGFDGDSDRIGVVDENGKMVLGDELMVLYARSILARSPGSTIIGDVKCSDRMYHDIEKHGGRALMWKTGHSLVKEKIKQEKAPFGGELSGHIFFADRNYGYDDAVYAGFRLLEILSVSGKKLSELLADLPKSHNTPEIRIDTTEEKKIKIVDRLKQHFAGNKQLKVNLLDGIRVSYPDGWALARASNTQPVLVLRFESSTESGLARIRSEFESVVKPLL